MYCPIVTLQGQGGNDCEFVASVTVDGHFAMFESAIQPGSHFGALPSGQITSPTQTTKTSDASQFRILYVVSWINAPQTTMIHNYYDYGLYLLLGEKFVNKCRTYEHNYESLYMKLFLSLHYL